MITNKMILTMASLFFILVACTGCGGNATAEVVTMEVTREVEVTQIVYVPVTVTWTPTPVNSPTVTSTPTITPTPTDTPTATPTPNATQTQQAIINATQGADATATQAAKITKATEIASYSTIDIQEILNYPEDHIGEKVKIQGEVFNIRAPYTVQIYVTNLGYGYWSDAVYIVIRDKLSGLYEDDLVTVYGTVEGRYCFQSMMGGQICQPSLIEAFYEK